MSTTFYFLLFRQRKIVATNSLKTDFLIIMNAEITHIQVSLTFSTTKDAHKLSTPETKKKKRRT